MMEDFERKTHDGRLGKQVNESHDHQSTRKNRTVPVMTDSTQQCQRTAEASEDKGATGGNSEDSVDSGNDSNSVDSIDNVLYTTPPLPGDITSAEPHGFAKSDNVREIDIYKSDGQGAIPKLPQAAKGGIHPGRKAVPSSPSMKLMVRTVEPVFDKPLDDKYHCVVSRYEKRHILHHSIQSFCGHRLCQECKNKLFHGNPAPKCPGCLAEKDEENEYLTLKEGTVFPDRAIDREIGMLKVRCPAEGCTWTGKYKEFRKHLSLCAHQEEKCPFGCEQSIAKDGKDQHYEKNVHKHLESLLRLITSLPNSSSGGSNGQNALEKVSSLEKEVSGFEKRIEDETKSGKFQKHGALVNNGELKEVQKNCETTLNVVAVLNNEVEKLIKETSGVQMRQSTDSGLMTSLQQKVKNLERDLARKDIAIAERDMRIQALEMTSYDGVLVWPIKEFSRLKAESLRGGSQSIYSPPFFTSRCGYKLCARIYLNGDGMGKGSHISLFLVVMRGPYDAILKWPFRQKVTLMLLDQNQREHIIDAFRPDPTSSSFKRPVNDMNIASGCPMFAPLAKVEDRKSNYLKDDTVFVKIIVDPTE